VIKVPPDFAEDTSGKTIEEIMLSAGHQLVEYAMLPDKRAIISRQLIVMCQKAGLILTTGGTGLSPRDVTPEATLDVIEGHVPVFPKPCAPKVWR
jgi:molybdopterin adenylyltransferase